jgi:hypothetical protein
MKHVAACLAGALIGVLVMLAGLTWDYAQHLRNPHLGMTETLFSLDNPSHVVFAVGVTMTAGCVLGAFVLALRADKETHWWSRQPARTVLPAAAVIGVAAVAAIGALLGPALS